MEPENIYLTSDGEFYADALARVLDDRERNAAWLASGGTLDERDTLVERTPSGVLVVEALYPRRFVHVESGATEALDAVPVDLRAG